MFYCDQCAKEHQYPSWADDKLKSRGPCEICKNTRPCNDVQDEMLDLGAVELYLIKKNVFLNPKKPSFYAPEYLYRVIGFDLRQGRELRDNVVVAVNYKEDYDDISDARGMVKELRSKVDPDSDQQYFLFNSDGYMERIE